jgi:hypothetical protein
MWFATIREPTQPQYRLNNARECGEIMWLSGGKVLEKLLITAMLLFPKSSHENRQTS